MAALDRFHCTGLLVLQFPVSSSQYPIYYIAYTKNTLELLLLITTTLHIQKNTLELLLLITTTLHIQKHTLELLLLITTTLHIQKHTLELL